MTRHGKIARLPRAVREKLNERLDNGEAGVGLAKWLNSLPEVKKVLRESFGGQPITPQNLSQWKCGGFVEWQGRQEALGDAREMAAGAKDLQKATEYMFSDYLATVLAARYAKVLSGWDGKVTEEFNTQLRALRSMCLDVAELRRGDHSRERVALEGRRLHQNRERTEREVYEMFKEWAFQPAVRNCLLKDWETPEQKEARLEEIFGLGQRSDGVVGGDGEGAEEGSDGVVAGHEPGNPKSEIRGPNPANEGDVIQAAGGTAASAVAAGASAGTGRATEGPARQEPRADVLNARPTGSAVHAEAAKIEVDRSKSRKRRARPRARKGDEGAGGTGGTAVPVAAAAAVQTPAPLAGKEILVDPSKSQEQQAAAQEKGGTAVPLANSTAGETPAPLAAAVSASAGTGRANEGPARQEPRADVLNARPTGLEVDGEAERIEVDRGNSQGGENRGAQAEPRKLSGELRALPGSVPQRFAHARRVRLLAPGCNFSIFGSSVGPNSRAR